MNSKTWYSVGFLEGSSVFLGVCLAKCLQSHRDGEKGMASAFLVLGMV